MDAGAIEKNPALAATLPDRLLWYWFLLPGSPLRR